MLPYHLLAVAFALLLPTLLFVAGGVSRSQRSANFQDLIRALFPEGGSLLLPQVYLVGAKYDAPVERPREAEANSAKTAEDAPEEPTDAERKKRQPLALMAPALIYAALTLIGFELLLIPIAGLVRAYGHPLPGYEFAVRQAFVWTVGDVRAEVLQNTVAVVCMAFLGSYVANARFLVKQTLNSELNGMSFARATLLMIMGVTIALVSYRAAAGALDWADPKPEAAATAPQASVAPTKPPVASDAPNKPKDASAPATTAKGGTESKGESCWGKECPDPVGIWLGVAFLIGYAPEIGLTLLSRRVGLWIQKNPPKGFYKTVEYIPVEIIDGINAQMAYRLEQNNIEDVQNLATANPLELYIETPYGLFECFDWVLQAQLCVVVGWEVFLELRKHGIRTIFDLERAVLSEPPPPKDPRAPEDAPLPSGPPADYILAIGRVFFKHTSDEFRAQLTPEMVVHAVAVSCDDLHVLRLRTLWSRIASQARTKDDPRWLNRTSPVMGDRD